MVSSPASDPAGRRVVRPARWREGKPVGLGMADDDGHRSPGRPVAVKTRARRGGRSCGDRVFSIGEVPSAGKGSAVRGVAAWEPGACCFNREGLSGLVDRLNTSCVATRGFHGTSFPAGNAMPRHPKLREHYCVQAFWLTNELRKLRNNGMPRYLTP